MVHYERLSSSANHPLDWRLVLGSPPLQKLFKDQVRAILRASVVGQARILVPLVTSSELLDFVLATVKETHEELRREGLDFAPRVPLGIMIEVAAATAMVEAWARHVDYFALGTNDLIASALGIDREDPVGANRNDTLHPGLLRIIDQVVQAAHRAGRHVTVCGEMASDPEGAGPRRIASRFVERRGAAACQRAGNLGGSGCRAPDQHEVGTPWPACRLPGQRVLAPGRLHDRLKDRRRPEPPAWPWPANFPARRVGADAANAEQARSRRETRRSFMQGLSSSSSTSHEDFSSRTDLITTSSSGTSPWTPFRVVFTSLILSTTSMPSMTLPKTQ